MKQDPHS